MRHSIRKKFTLIFVGLFAVLVLAMLVFYSFFLLKFYRQEKIKQLQTAYETVDNAIIEMGEEGEDLLNILKDDYDQNTEDSESISMLRNLSERSNIDIVMMNSAGTLSAATSRESEWNLMKLKAYVSFNEVFGDYENPFFPILGDEPVGAAGSSAEPDKQGRNGNTNEGTANESARGGSGGNKASEAPAGQSNISQGDASKDGKSAEGKSYGNTSDSGSKSASSGNSGSGNSENNGSNGSSDNTEKHSPAIEVIERTDNYVIQLFNDKRSGTGYLECWGLFSDKDTYFLMTMPIASMEEGVGISRAFLITISIAILVIGAVAVYFTTGLITKPITNLADISEKVTNLDFSARYTGKQKDEIGVLGESMNSMSEKLEETIRELKEANAKLQEDIDAKVKIDEMRKEFIADVSHELKTPIAIIEGYAEGLVEGIAEDKDTRDYYCNIIMDEAGKMNKLVKQLTSLINYEFGDNQNDKSVFNLTELVRSVLDAQKIRLEDAGALVETALPDETIIEADEFKMEEAFTNYLNNAINHLEGDKHINIAVKEDGENWRLSVYNDGMPIPEESIPKLWDKFYKVDKSRSRQYGGSGIGLSIVKAIIDSHNGSCGVINHEHGVEFWFTIKQHPAETAEAPETSEE